MALMSCRGDNTELNGTATLIDLYLHFYKINVNSRTVNVCSGLASAEVSGIETDFSDVVSVQQPAEEPLQTQTIPV